MNPLFNQLQRLYFLPDQQWQSPTGEAGDRPTLPLTPEEAARRQEQGRQTGMATISPARQCRAMVADFPASAWAQAAKLYQGIGEGLELPAPAVAVSGQGLQLWFSLAEPVAVDEAQAFLDALRRRYLPEIPVNRPGFSTSTAGQGVVDLVPACLSGTGHWSAYIDPSLAGMFGEEPWLEMAPNPEKQADLLAGVDSIKPVDFQRALLALGTARPEPGGGCLAPGTRFSDPGSFLLAVMNDESITMDQRIKAAAALLPYFARSETK